MKSAIYLLAIISMALASEIIESEPVKLQEIVPSQQYFNQDLWSMSPSERERFGINLKRDRSYESMPVPMPMNNNPWNDYMMMGYPNMMYQNQMMMYPGYNQNINLINSNCGCQQVCPPCYLPWLCIPCQCPCQTTTSSPPDSDTAPPSTETSTTSTTTTSTTAMPTTTSTQAISTCVPCTNPCNPCGPVWMPWIPCNNICVCNNGCQTVTPAPLISTTVATIERGNNCQCECAPCSPLVPCPPCPKNCPCH
ncbi:hypothetical protein PVAND_000322 [Polypedilum vanderplanki]|uniref:Uncharacterized protein n=1 Tax=Polypedilum vanderplanki TaxID=319348 RepID=A0A9J6BJN1_POLVA|nr:hypothetical protein PVAND_000322 [Polypedilum vanderplanki]